MSMTIPEALRPPLRRAWLAVERRIERAYSKWHIRSQVARISLLPPTRAEREETARFVDELLGGTP